MSFKHAHQIVTGDLVFEENNNPKNYSIRHEVEAYTAEFGTNGHIYYLPQMSIINNGQINFDDMLKFEKGDNSLKLFQHCITSPSEITPEKIREFS